MQLVKKLSLSIDSFSEQATSTHAKLVRNYFLIALLLAFLIFGSKLNNAFASDDWPATLRNSTFQLSDLPVWFTQLRAGWYRPVHDLFIAMNWTLFKVNFVGYRVVSLLVYAVVAALVGWLLRILANDQRVGYLGTVLFAVFAPHAEPVIWFAGTNELLAGIFVLLSTSCYVLYRQRQKPYLLVVVCVASYLAFASKETAVFFPLLLLLYDLLTYLEQPAKQRSWRTFQAFIPVAIVWLGFLLFRIPMGSSYSESLNTSIVGLVKNGVYYLLIVLFLLPNNFAFLSAIDSWKATPVIPLATVLLTITSLGLLFFVWWRQIRFANKRLNKNLLFFIAWFGLALGPVIFIVTERASFLATIGAVGVVSLLFVAAWDAVADKTAVFKNTLIAALVIYLGVNVFVLSYRAYWFEQSADMNQALMSELQEQAERLPPNSRLVIANLPDHTEFTFTFRNVFPPATTLMNIPLHVFPILDSELATLSPTEQADKINSAATAFESDFIFWYEAGDLILQE